ncbi:ABC transporter substrate-binding protein [Bacteriovorax sp. Seq25_V]|uniref:substrate-binding periplasmic protein n=1 Tax=Bacteriovorax sp. Seq25_V TaxID=1201288 RepID=UPI00038A195B|nr:transporter substrate-binding domain-containing protein [Bacteriovorax sp. Seq25_V]EQC47468.1 ABC transporter, substrate-binding protein, family 3 [Bacteriovorax sp. Seq25_V]
MLLILRTLISISFALSVSANSFPNGELISICAEDAGWPPFSIPEISENGETGNVSGFNKELISKIFNKHHINFKFIIKPWSRCLYEAIHGDINIVVDAATNPQREKDYILTNTIYTLTPIYFFNKKNKDSFSANIKASTLYTKGDICGQSGYTYTNFGLDNNKIKMVSKDLASVLDLVSKGRCTIGLTRREVLDIELKNFKDADEIQSQTIADVEVENFYWLVNKNYKYTKELVHIINSELLEMRKNGSYSKLISELKN